MTTIAVTGATGGVGGRLARRLADAGLEQRLIVRDDTRAPRLHLAEVRVAEYRDVDASIRALDGVDVLFESERQDVLLVAVGSMADLALEVAERLSEHGIGATVIDPRWVVPVPFSVIEQADAHRIVVSIEDGVRVGGIGTRIRQDLRAAGVDTAVDELGLPDEFLEHASREEILAHVGLTVEQITEDVVAQVRGNKIPIARPVLPADTAELHLH